MLLFYAETPHNRCVGLSKLLKLNAMLIQKTTQEDRMKNTLTLEQLMFSFFDLNILGFKRVLSDQGVFTGKSKMAFLSSLNSKFNEIKEQNIHGINIFNGISLDKLPGCEVLEVRYALNSELLDENGLYFTDQKSPAREGEVILRFAFRFEAGKVAEIQYSRAFVHLNKLCQAEDKTILN
jgi:hypothetical protein